MVLLILKHEHKEYDLALESFKKALEVRIENFGLMHADVAKTYNKIGKVLYLQGNHAQALDYYLKAFAIFENNVGIEHAYTAKTYENIGEVYCGQGNYNQAMDNFQKALVIFEKVLPKEHSAIIHVKELIKKNQYQRLLDSVIIKSPNHLRFGDCYYQGTSSSNALSDAFCAAVCMTYELFLLIILSFTFYLLTLPHISIAKIMFKVFIPDSVYLYAVNGRGKEKCLSIRNKFSK